MTARTLPPDEWHKLVGTEAEGIEKLLDPKSTSVIVVENQHGAIVGCWLATYMLHAECLWVRDDYRGKSSVQRWLWGAMRDVIRKCGARGFITAAIDDKVRELIQHVGGRKLPGDHYVVGVD